VIKQNIIFTLKEHVLDSLHAIHAALNDANGMIKNQKLEINRLTTELGQVQDELEKTQKEKDSMSLLGQQLKKSSYRKITWAVIGILLALLLTFIVKYKSSSAITLSTEKKLSDLENEYADHRRISLEREQKIKRQLQDEINKGIA
jgi:septal ring factor EnvC (AmiA/AmiB activator)